MAKKSHNPAEAYRMWRYLNSGPKLTRIYYRQAAQGERAQKGEYCRHGNSD